MTECYEEFLGNDCWVRYLVTEPYAGGYCIKTLTIVVKTRVYSIKTQDFKGGAYWAQTTNEELVDYVSFNFQLNPESVKYAIDSLSGENGFRMLRDYHKYLLKNQERILELAKKLVVKDML